MLKERLLICRNNKHNKQIFYVFCLYHLTLLPSLPLLQHKCFIQYFFFFFLCILQFSLLVPFYIDGTYKRCFMCICVYVSRSNDLKLEKRDSTVTHIKYLEIFLSKIIFTNICFSIFFSIFSISFVIFLFIYFIFICFFFFYYSDIVFFRKFFYFSYHNIFTVLIFLYFILLLFILSQYKYFIVFCSE